MSIRPMTPAKSNYCCTGRSPAHGVHMSERASACLLAAAKVAANEKGALRPAHLHTALPIFGATIAALVLLSLPAFAQSAPALLHGKSIVATWNENRMQRLAGKGEFRPMSIPSGISVYVSTAGRMFVRRFAAGRGGTAGRESLGTGSSAAGAHASAFRGRSLNVTASFVGGGAGNQHRVR
jgi:hypothetical protein